MPARTAPTLEPWERHAHERHVYLYRHCRLCVAEANGQRDRLLDDAAILALTEDDAARLRAVRS